MQAKYTNGQKLEANKWTEKQVSIFFLQHGSSHKFVFWLLAIPSSWSKNNLLTPFTLLPTLTIEKLFVNTTTSISSCTNNNPCTNNT
jgi:hypothetical protein